MNEQPDFQKIEKLLNDQKIKKVPPHLLSRFSEEVLERIENKPSRWPRFEFRLFPVLAPVAIGILIAVVLLPDLNKVQSARAPEPVRTAKTLAPLSFEQQLRLLDLVDDESVFEVAAAEIESGLSIEDEMRLLEELGANHISEDELTDEEAVLYQIEATTSRG